MKATLFLAGVLMLAGCSDGPHRFTSCAEAKQAGAPLPLTPNSPGWNPRLDRDHDGEACQ